MAVQANHDHSSAPISVWDALSYLDGINEDTYEKIRLYGNEVYRSVSVLVPHLTRLHSGIRHILFAMGRDPEEYRQSRRFHDRRSGRMLESVALLRDSAADWTNSPTQTSMQALTSTMNLLTEIVGSVQEREKGILVRNFDRMGCPIEIISAPQIALEEPQAIPDRNIHMNTDNEHEAIIATENPMELPAINHNPSTPTDVKHAMLYLICVVSHTRNRIRFSDVSQFRSLSALIPYLTRVHIAIANILTTLNRDTQEWRISHGLRDASVYWMPYWRPPRSSMIALLDTASLCVQITERLGEQEDEVVVYNFDRMGCPDFLPICETLRAQEQAELNRIEIGGVMMYDDEEDVDTDDDEVEPLEAMDMDSPVAMAIPGLSKEEIERLGVSRATKSEEIEKCTVCQSNFCEGDEIRALPCNHMFHKACIDPWLLESNTCPNDKTIVCRRNAE